MSGEDHAIEPVEWAGLERGYLDNVSLSPAEDHAPAPAVQAVTANTAIRINEIRTTCTPGERWCQEASSRGFASAIAIPIRFDGVTIGVVAAYAETPAVFEPLPADGIQELGELIGRAIAASHRRAGILTDKRREYEFEITDPRCVLLCFARDTGSSFSVKGVVPRHDQDESAVVFVSVAGSAAGALLDVLESSLSVREPTVIDDGEESVVRFVLTEPFIGSTLANFGIKLRQVTATEGAVRAVLACPPTMPSGYVDTVVSSVYPESKLVATSSGRQLTTEAALTEGVFSDMTARQVEAMETAYREGFFKWPRENTGRTSLNRSGSRARRFTGTSGWASRRCWRRSSTRSTLPRTNRIRLSGLQ